MQRINFTKGAKMKRKLFITVAAIFCLILLFCGGCNADPQPYSTFENSTNIEQISVVRFYNDNSYNKLKTLTEADATEFWEKFNEIKFEKYIFGDPTSINNDELVILFEYKNGNREFVSYYAQKIIVAKSSDTFFGKVYCDKTSFLNFLNDLLNND